MELLNFTEQHKTYRKHFQKFLETDVIPHIDDWERDHMTPKSAWKKMGQAGFLCPWVSTEYGGMGGDFLHSIVINKELSWTNHTGLMAYLHSDIIVPYINTFGTQTQKKKYLPGCVSGDIVMAVAMTEPDSGSDLASMSTTAVEEGNEVVINGSKTFISIGYNCDLVIVAAKDPKVANPHKAISLYLVEDGTPGFIRGSKFEKMGMHSQDTAELFFNNCTIPIENRLGEKGSGFVMLMQKLQQERLMVAMMSVWAAEFALEWVTNYYRKTDTNGGGPSTSQAVQFAIAEMATDVMVGKNFVYKLAADHMEKKSIVTETSMAKFWASDMAKRVTSKILEMVGTDGLKQGCPVSRTWCDVQVYSIFAGTNEIMKTIIAKSMKL